MPRRTAPIELDLLERRDRHPRQYEERSWSQIAVPLIYDARRISRAVEAPDGVDATQGAVRIYMDLSSHDQFRSVHGNVSE